MGSEGRGIGHDRLVVDGGSIGTGVATRVAARRSLAALVLEAPFTSVAAIAERLFPWLPVRWLLRDRFDQLSRIGRVTAPILILQGSRDDAASAPKRLWIAPGGRADDLMEYGACARGVEFVDRATSGSPIMPPASIEIAN